MLISSDRPFPSGTIWTPGDRCPRCSGPLCCCNHQDERRFCTCGYYRCAPAKSAARLLVAGRAEYRRVVEALDKITATLNVGTVLIYGTVPEAAQWATLNEINVIGDKTVTMVGLLQRATHVVCFGDPPDDLDLRAEDAGKPFRALPSRRRTA